MSILQEDQAPDLARADQPRADQLLAADATGHWYECPIRWADIDSFGHVSNVKYLEYFQDARIHFGRDVLGVESADQLGVSVVVRAEIDYRRPLPYSTDPATVRTWVTRIGRTSYELQAAICKDDAVYATSHIVLVRFDPVNGRSRALTDAERLVLEAWLV
jgi:acyl-CoA thioester hydrolase